MEFSLTLGTIEQPFDLLLGNETGQSIDFVNPTGTLAGQVNQINTSTFVDTILLHGGDDVLTDDGVGRRLYGNQGNDIINANGGDDLVRGGQGSDILIGGAGNDILSGDKQSDTLTGGTGSDRFDFGDPSEGNDVVTDFVDGEDRIGLRNGLSFELLSIEQVGNNVEISTPDIFGEISLTLQNANVANIDASDFQAVPLEDQPSFLFVQNATGGTFDLTTNTLQLTGVSSETLAFSDRPFRIVEDTETDLFVETLFSPSSSFAADPPNAVLDIGSGAALSPLELRNPVYDEQNATLTYEILPLREGSEPPAAFGPNSLFIDGFISTAEEIAPEALSALLGAV